MAGGSAGQFVVGPLMAAGVSWRVFWGAMGLLGLAISVVLLVLLPPAVPTARRDDWRRSAAGALGQVFRNPQSIFCGAIAGLLFLPTTIFDMIWGVRFLQDARGVEYASAVMRSATVPLGRIIGCPLLGFLSARLGRRKPVIAAGAVVLLACFALILHGPAGVVPPYVVGIVAGVASGAAMLTYTVIKEANAPEVSGTATGVVKLPALDPGVVLYLFQQLGPWAKDVEAILYKKSGLLALSGISNDMRDLLASPEPGARLAVDYFVYRAAKEIGALAATIRGLDGLVFTAGIGERSVPIRRRICDASAWLGIDVDLEANERHGPRISMAGSRVSAWVIPTDEELIIARHTGRMLGLETAH